MILYETAPVDMAAETAEALGRSDAVLLHSPRAAEVLAGVLKLHPAPQMRALGLSRR